MTTVLLTALAVAPILFLLGQGPLRRHRLATVEREFHAQWSRLSPAQKVHALRLAGAPADDPDTAALGLIRRAWDMMRAAGEVDFHRLREYGDVLIQTAARAQ